MRKTVALLAAALGASLAPAQELAVERVPGATPRNVVFILTDDHRHDAMSFLGHQFAETPNMDAIARAGVHFPNAMVTTSLCSPSRASILTGLYTFRHGVVDNSSQPNDDVVYFPQYLQAAGHSTAFIGKWHMGDASDDPQPGFDHWVSFAGQGHYLPPSEDYTLNVNGERVPQRGYITDELTGHAVQWLETQRGAEEPFFLYLSHKAVHANFTPAERHEGRFRDKPFQRPRSEDAVLEAPNMPRWLRDQRNSWHGVDFPYHSALDIEGYYKRYCETLSAVDDGIGAVMDKLQDMGVLDDTLVIYTSDNGFLFGERGLIDKRVAYEDSIRVPFLMQCPALLPAGETRDTPIANIDFGPTILEAMGLRAPAHMDGRSFLPIARGEEIPWRENFLYVYLWESHFPHTPTTYALRGPRHKLITYHGIWDAFELYDLQEDPEELNNLFYDPAHRDLAASMHQELVRTLKELGGLQIPLGHMGLGGANLRLLPRGGGKAADFPGALVVPAPINENAI